MSLRWPCSSTRNRSSPLHVEAPAARRDHAFELVLVRQREDVAHAHLVGRVAFDEEHALAVGRTLEHAGRHPRQVGALRVAVAQLAAVAVDPGPGEHQQQAHHQQHRPEGAQHRPHEARQVQPAGKPDGHLAVAVHAPERDDDGDEQRHAQDGRQMPQRRVTQHQHHVLWVRPRRSAASDSVRISSMVMTMVSSTTSVAPKLRASSRLSEQSNNMGRFPKRIELWTSSTRDRAQGLAQRRGRRAAGGGRRGHDARVLGKALGAALCGCAEGRRSGATRPGAACTCIAWRA